MSAGTVLYDAPGPRTRRRHRIWSVVVAMLLLAVLAAGTYAMHRNGIFNDRWLVLVDPPRGQTATNVWWDSLLLRGLIQGTLKAAALAAPIALALSVVIAILRISPRPWLRIPATVVIEVFRGLPVLLMMVLAYVAFGTSPYTAVVFGLVVYNSAVFAEILRAGLVSLAKGQGEAGVAIGLTGWQNLRLILLPQAVRVMMPSLVSQLVVLLKDTSIGFIVAYLELLRVSQQNYSFFGDESRLPIFVAVLAIYLLVNFALARFAILIEARLRQRGQKVKLPGNVAASANPKEAGAL